MCRTRLQVCNDTAEVAAQDLSRYPLHSSKGMRGRRLDHGPQRVLLLGDTHGSARWIGRAARVAMVMGLDGIVQLGDFGYLPEDRWHQQFLAATERVLSTAQVPLWFLRGNHDDADALAQISQTDRRDEIDAIAVSPHVRYLPCGTRWTWNSTRFGVLGGAFSVNRGELIEGESWWPGELIDQHAVGALGAERLDVLLTHEAPLASTTILDRYASADRSVEQICTTQRRLVGEAVRATCAGVVVHGHHHVRYDETAHDTGHDTVLDTKVIGLSCETWESMVVLDTTTGTVSAVSRAAMRAATSAPEDAVLRLSQYAERHLETRRAS